MHGRISLLLAAALAFSTSPAHAQDYTVTAEPGRLWEEPPQNATRYELGEGAAVGLQLPFTFSYYGALFDDVLVTSAGFIKLGAQTAWPNHELNPQIDHFFPVSSSSPEDGFTAIMWQNVVPSSPPLDSRMEVWTSGTVPERRWVVAWINYRFPTSNGANFSCQIQLHEATGRLAFAWVPAALWNGAKYGSGLDSPGDTRFTSWIGAHSRYALNPSADYRFDPRKTTYTGSLLYERPTTSESGPGAGVDHDAPLPGFLVELRRNGGVVGGRALADGNGDYSIDILGAATDDEGGLWLVSESAACRLVDGSDVTYEYTVDGDIDYSRNDSIATFYIAGDDDANGASRAPLRICEAIWRVYDLVSSRAATPVSRLAVLYSRTAGGVTRYVPRSGSIPPSLSIGGPGGTTPDQWDEARIMAAYSRHVVAELAAVGSSEHDPRLDAVTDVENAFGEGLGTFLFAAATGKSVVHDEQADGSVTSFDLESPSLTSARGPAVAGWAASALYDLLDGADEIHDRVDGTVDGADRVVAVLDALSAVPTPQNFVDEWANQFSDAADVVRIFAAHGLLPDDTLEPNDDAGEPAALGALGQRRSGLTLNRHSEDWFSFDLAQGVAALNVQARVEMGSPAAEMEVELRTSGGQVLASGTAVQGSVPATLAPGALAAGTYHVRVRHVSGAAITPYTLQVYEPLSLAGTDLPDWTQGIPYDAAITVIGGVPPYTFAVNAPPGLSINSAARRMVGTPSQAGTYSLTLEVDDDGRPLHENSSVQSVVIHPPLDLGLPEYVPLAEGKAQAPHRYDTGGTPPLRFLVTQGALPAGLSLGSTELVFSGLAGTTGTTDLTITGDDAVGDDDTAQVTAVVCAPVPGKDAPADVAATDRAGGFFVDALVGSRISLKAKTAKKRAKRTLTAVVAGPDGLPLPDAKTKGGTGKASAAFTCAATGRYSVILPAAAGEATQLLATASVTPPKALGGKAVGFGPGSVVRVEIGALAGATLKLLAKTDKKSGVTAVIGALLDPAGTSVPLGGLVTTKGTKVMLEAPLPSAGTWTVLIGAVGGEPGTLSYKASIKQPKGAAFALD